MEHTEGEGQQRVLHQKEFGPQGCGSPSCAELRCGHGHPGLLHSSKLEKPWSPNTAAFRCPCSPQHSCRDVWWASLPLRHRSWCETQVLCQQVPVPACPLARGRPLVLGTWGIWSHCSGQIPSGAVGGCSEAKEVGGTDGDAVAEPNPRVEIMGAGPACHGVREEE